jgi:hypothetical protein
MSLLPHEDLSVPLLVPPAEFHGRLNAVLVPSPLRLLFRNGFVGSASDTAVRVRWARKFVSNDLAPEFRGTVSPDHRFVRGTFRQRGWVIALVYASVALGLGGIILGLSAGAGLDRRWVYGAIGALIAFAFLLPRLGWAMGHSDIERITAALRAAARGQSVRVEGA